MNKNFFAGGLQRLLIVLLIGGLCLTSCAPCDGCDCDCDGGFSLFSFSKKVRGSGVLASKTIPMSGVTGVALQFHGELTIEIGDKEQLTVEADDNLLEYIQGVVADGLLTIHKVPERGTLDTTLPVRYHLTIKKLESIKVSDSGSVYAPALQADSFTVTITSSADVHIESLQANRLSVRLSSSGGLTIAGGKVALQEIELTSSGEYNAGDLQSDIAGVRISSSGNATVYVLERLEADLSSSGDVFYRGSPSILTSDSSSTGRVRQTP